MGRKRIKENNMFGQFSTDGECGAELTIEFSPDLITLDVARGGLGHFSLPVSISTPISVHKSLNKLIQKVENGLLNKKDEYRLHILLEEYMRRNRMYEVENKRELRKIKNRILDDYNVKYYLTNIVRDTDWSNFRKLIKAMQDVEGVNNISYGVDPNPYYQSGYRWKDGKQVSKHYVLDIDTDVGHIYGQIICAGAGSVEDPLDAYDMTVNLYSV